MNTKVDFINGAYSRMRVSGITKIPDSADLKLALSRLESMAAMWFDKINTGYHFEDEPDPNTPHNVPAKYWSAYESNLAMLLLADFGKQPMPTLMSESTGSLSAMFSSAAKVEQILPPRRQPVGSGNRLSRWQRYYSNDEQVSIDTAINTMTTGDVNDFTEHFDSYLNLSEVISSYTISSSTPAVVAVSADTNTDEDVTFRATAVSAGTVSVTIKVTTDLGRIETRNIVFRVADA